MQLNPTFISHIHDLYGDTGGAWLQELPNLLSQLSTLWNFHFLNPVPNLSYNFVGLVKMNETAKTAVLKIAPDKGSLITEMRWLKRMAEGVMTECVPEIYASDETLEAYLMEHLVPGHSLKSLLKENKDDEATKIICQTILKLQSPPANNFNLPHLSELSKALSLLKGKFDARLLSKAESLFRDLSMDRTGDILLHGDLHHDNILASGLHWKAIDPHGYIGDPAAEGGAMIRNAFECLPKDRSVAKIVENRLKIMGDELPYDAQKIRFWAFCITVLSGAWSLEDHKTVPQYVIETAIAIDEAKV